MAIQAVPASPIGWVDATEDKLQPCPDLNFCLPVNRAAEHSPTFQIIANKVGSDLSEGLRLLPEVSGANTAVVANDLVDGGASFNTDDIEAGDWVVNTSTNAQTTCAVTPAVATVVDLSADIFTATPENYEILRIQLPAAGVVTYDSTNNELDASATASFQVNFRNLLPALNTRYAVEVDFSNFTKGSVLARFGDAIEPAAKSPRATGNGTWTFYGGEDNGTDFDFVLEDDSLNASWTITAIRIYATSEPSIDLVDENDAQVDTFVETDFVHDRAVVAIGGSWAAIKAGCYHVEVFDDELDELVENSGLDHLMGDDFAWTFTNTDVGWRVQANTLDHVGGGAAGTDIAVGLLKATTEEGCTYTLSYDQVSTGSVKAKIVLEDGTDVTLLTTSTIATHTVNFTGYKAVSVRFDAEDTATPQLDNIKVSGQGSCPKLTSENICLFTTNPDVCKIIRTIDAADSEVRKLLGMWADTSAYTEAMYLCINVRFARYADDEYEGYRDSAGAHSVVFSDGVEVFELQLTHAPRYVHDWLRAALKSDDFTIEGVSWYPYAGEYSPTHDKRIKISGAVVEIVKQDQDVGATLC